MNSILDNWPIYFKDLLDVKDISNNVGVVTLWSKKDLFSKLNCNTIGTCYSLEGVKYLLRNLAGNTNIRYLILCGVDLSGSGNLIKNIFSGNLDLLNKDFSESELKSVVNNVEIIDLIGVTDIKKIQEKIDSLSKKEAYGDATELSVKESVFVKRPSERSGFIIREKNIVDAWLNSLKLIKEYGVEKNTNYGIGSLEILNLVTVTNENLDRYLPEFADISREKLESYELQIGTGKKIDSVEYTYGQRLCKYFGFDQIDWAISQLKKSKDSRRIFLTLWDSDKDSKSSLPPCLDLIQFIVQNNVLYMSAYFRSHDIFAGYLLNVFGLRKIHERVAEETGLNIGELTTISCSAHVYYNDLEKSDKLISENRKLNCTPDPRGYFYIEVKDKIIVKYLDTSGQIIKTYFGLTAKEIYNQLVLDFSVSQLSHAFYLGYELKSAELSLHNNKGYLQDSS